MRKQLKTGHGRSAGQEVKGFQPTKLRGNALATAAACDLYLSINKSQDQPWEEAEQSCACRQQVDGQQINTLCCSSAHCLYVFPF